MTTKLTHAFYQRGCTAVAQELIGCYLVRQTPQGRIVGRINETEAYPGVEDKAGQAYRGRRTPQNEMLYAGGGVAYINLAHGQFYCLHVVAGTEGEPAAVLLRGLEIVDGLVPAAQNRYGHAPRQLTRWQRQGLANGPGKLCQALAIHNGLNGEDLAGDQLYICSSIDSFAKTVDGIRRSKRIGIEYAEEARDLLLRFTG